MKPAPFSLEQPDNLRDALELRAEDSVYAVALAGGQSLMPLLNLRLSTPDVVIDLNRVPELTGIRYEDGRLVVGSMTRQAAVEDDLVVRKRLPALSRMVSLIGHRTIRNRGTIGGSLCHADPSAELPALALAIDAEMVASSIGGTRVVQARDFNQGYLSTDLGAAELLTEIRWPIPPPRSIVGSSQFVRRSGDFALAAILAVLDFGHGEKLERVAVVAYGSLSKPVRLTAVEDVLREDPVNFSAGELGELCESLVDPASDLHGSAEYKKRLFSVVARRAFEQVAEQLRGGRL